MNMIFAFIVLFFLPIALKECRSISNIEHVLSRVLMVIHDRRQQKKRKRKQVRTFS